MSKRESRSPVPLVKPCGSYLPGHTIHWIQARKAAEDQASMIDAEIVSMGLHHILVRLEDGTSVKYGNHDMERLRAIAAEAGPAVRVQERWGVLWIGNHLFSIRRTGQHAP